MASKALDLIMSHDVFRFWLLQNAKHANSLADTGAKNNSGARRAPNDMAGGSHHVASDSDRHSFAMAWLLPLVLVSKNHDWHSCGTLPKESLTHRYTCDAMSGQTPDALDPHMSRSPNRF